MRASEPEASLARAAGVACALVALPLVAGAAWLHGPAGAAGALAGVGLAVVAFAGAGALASWAGSYGVSVLAAVVVTGLVLRLTGYLVALYRLAGITWIHRPSLAVAAACATTFTLVYEIRAALSDPRYFWVHTARGAAQ